MPAHGLVFPYSPRTPDPNRGGLSQLHEVHRLLTELL